MNQPDRVKQWIFEPDEERMRITDDPKIPNAIVVELKKQDHTLGNMLRSQLLLDPCVLFAGYRVPHPLEPIIQLRVQSDPSYCPPPRLGEAPQPCNTSPRRALLNACIALVQLTRNLREQWDQQVKTAELGLGPVAVSGAGGAGAGVGGVGGMMGMEDAYGMPNGDQVDGMGFGAYPDGNAGVDDPYGF